jgi:transcriptional regulator with XRE-family HTH domain
MSAKPSTMHTPRESFGACLYRLRRQRDLSQQQLSSALRVARPYLSRIENERQRPPPLETAMRWAEALQLDAQARQDLLSACLGDRGEDQPTPDADKLVRMLRQATGRLPAAALRQIRQLERTLEGLL